MQPPSDLIIPVAPPPRSLICTLCQNILLEPVTTPCSHTFCRSCMDSFLDRAADLRLSQGHSVLYNVRCPAPGCMFVLTGKHLVERNSLADSQVKSLLVRCRFGLRWDDASQEWALDPNGCPTAFPLGEKDAHERVCSHAFVRCPNPGCMCMAKRAEVNLHTMKHCLKLPCAYASNGCPFQSSRDIMDSHMERCAFALQLHSRRMDDHCDRFNTTVNNLSRRLEDFTRSIGEIDTLLTRSPRTENNSSPSARRAAATASSYFPSASSSSPTSTPMFDKLQRELQMSQQRESATPLVAQFPPSPLISKNGVALLERAERDRELYGVSASSLFRGGDREGMGLAMKGAESPTLSSYARESRSSPSAAFVSRGSPPVRTSQFASSGYQQEQQQPISGIRSSYSSSGAQSPAW